MKRCLALLFLLYACTCAGAETFSAKVVTVMDGDTVTAMRDHKKITIRLAGIDAPEKLQAYGNASRDALAALVLRKDVHVTSKAVDEYGRIVAVLQVGRINVNGEQLRRGMAWEYSRYHADPVMTAMQAEAQQARRGLWADANPQPPWTFRKTHAPTHERQAAISDCGKKHHCSHMVSCEEAKFYLTQCRVKTLDKDGDGVPCENLCSAKQR